MRTAAASRASLPQLVDAIWKHKKGRSALSAKARAPAKVNRLSNLEIDGWELRSGVVSHERAPKTFYIPTNAERQGVRLGDFVKLIFEIAEGADRSDTTGERMWVKVTGTQGPYLLGTLANRPLTRRRNLQPGTRIAFLAEHIIDIDRPA